MLWWVSGTRCFHNAVLRAVSLGFIDNWWKPQEYVKQHNRPLDIPVTRVVEGGVSATFDASFDE